MILLSNYIPHMQLQNLGHNLNGHGIAILVDVTVKPFMFMFCNCVFTNHPNKTELHTFMCRPTQEPVRNSHPKEYHLKRLKYNSLV